MTARDTAHQKSVMNIVMNRYGKPLVSPTTFAICWYYLQKRYLDEKRLLSDAKNIFSEFDFTSETPSVMNKVFLSVFKDLEDALRYYYATDSKAGIIVTGNVHDYDKAFNPCFAPA